MIRADYLRINHILANYKSKPKLKVNKLAGIDRTISSSPGYEDEAGCENFYDCHYEVI